MTTPLLLAAAFCFYSLHRTFTFRLLRTFRHMGYINILNDSLEQAAMARGDSPDGKVCEATATPESAYLPLSTSGALIFYPHASM